MCGIVGVISKSPVNQLIYDALLLLQHRGQDAAGIGTPGSPLNGIAAFACAFLVVLVLWGLGARAVAALVGKTLLRPLDRLLGAVFGLARGLLVLLALATIVLYTPASASPAWRESQGAAWLNSILHELLPSLAPLKTEPGARSV